MGSLKVVEVMTSLNERSTYGRVVINPPKRMEPLKAHFTGEIKICCGRAFLSEQSFKKHLEERDREHLTELWNDKLIPEEEPVITAPHSSADNSHSESVKKKNITVTSLPIRKTTKVRSKPAVNCRLCGILQSKANYGRHLKLSHNPSNKIKCKWCTCTFPSQQNALRHSSRHHIVEHKKFCWNAATQNKHVISARKMTGVIKPLSKKTAPKKPDEDDDNPEPESVTAATVEVISKKKRKKSHECIFCGKVLINKISFQHHLLIHTGAKPYKCKLCGIAFRHTSNLSRHYKNKHSADLKFQCALCPDRAYSQSTLLEHMRRKHKESFPSQSNFSNEKVKQISPKRKTRYTIKEVTAMKPARVENGFQCGICQKVLKNLFGYRGHVLIHAKAFPHKCPKCNAKFRLKSTVQRHLATNHVEDGEFKCTLCCCSFICERSLRRHSQCYHSGKRKANTLNIKKKMMAKGKVEVPVERSLSPDIATLGVQTTAVFSRQSLGRASKTKTKKVINLPVPETKAVAKGGTTRKKVSQPSKSKPVEEVALKVLKTRQRSAASSETKAKVIPRSEPKRGAKRRAHSLNTRSSAKRGGKRAKLEEIERMEDSNAEILENKSRSPLKEKPLSPKRIVLKISKRRQVTKEASEVKKPAQQRRSLKELKDLPLDSPQNPEKSLEALEEVIPEKKGRARRGEPPDLQCKTCFKIFSSPQCKRLHETLHTGTMPYSCDYCNQQFRLFSTFNFHIKRFENPTGNFLCALCISRCGSEEALSHHMAIHKYKKRNYNK